MPEILLVREFSKQSFRPKLLLSTILKRFSLQFLLLPAGQKSEDSDLSACKATKPTIVQSVNFVVLEHLLRARKACHCPDPHPTLQFSFWLEVEKSNIKDVTREQIKSLFLVIISKTRTKFKETKTSTGHKTDFMRLNCLKIL